MSSSFSQSIALQNPDFRLKEDHDLLSPKDMLELARVGTGTANTEGDLVLVPVSKYSFEENKSAIHSMLTVMIVVADNIVF